MEEDTKGTSAEVTATDDPALSAKPYDVNEVKITVDGIPTTLAEIEANLKAKKSPEHIVKVYKETRQRVESGLAAGGRTGRKLKRATNAVMRKVLKEGAKKQKQRAETIRAKVKALVAKKAGAPTPLIDTGPGMPGSDYQPLTELHEKGTK